MPGKIFVNYRRDDGAANAARLRDRLAGVFGAANVFMDVDNLLAGQRFDKELEKALAQTDVFLAVIGPRWLELLKSRAAGEERDYVREEIAAALRRGIVVIPVLVERAVLPRGAEVPEDIREMVLHEKHDVTHEHFGRDTEALIAAIKANRKAMRAGDGSAIRPAPLGWIAASVAATVLAGWVGLHQMGVPVWSPWPAGLDGAAEARKKKGEADLATQAKRKTDEAERQGLAMLKVEEDQRGAVALRGPRVGETFRDCPDVCPEMVVVPAGEFMMGSNDYDDEKPVHKVTIKAPFAVSKFEVTFAEWEACVAGGGCSGNRSPSDQGWGKGRRPVINVSWHDAHEYVAWLSRKTGKTYRLLTEAEWEYAARAGTTTNYAFGNTITTSQAQFSTSSTAAVGSFPANGFGLHDMHGNVWEWCEDNSRADYNGAPQDGSVWAGGDASLRVVRGGSWSSSPGFLRSAIRDRGGPGFRSFIIGFRLARTL